MKKENELKSVNINLINLIEIKILSIMIEVVNEVFLVDMTNSNISSNSVIRPIMCQ